MFKKNNRLSKVEFSEFYTKGIKKHFPHLTIITHPSNKTKVSVVVGKKVAKSAVRRNTLRRRVYASLKNFEIKNKKSLGIFIVVVKPSYNTIPRKQSEEFLLESIAQVVKSE